MGSGYKSPEARCVTTLSVSESRAKPKDGHVDPFGQDADNDPQTIGSAGAVFPGKFSSKRPYAVVVSAHGAGIAARRFVTGHAARLVQGATAGFIPNAAGKWRLHADDIFDNSRSEAAAAAAGKRQH
jgi:hypothetical protein